VIYHILNCIKKSETYNPKPIEADSVVKALALVCPPDGSVGVGEIRKYTITRRPHLYIYRNEIHYSKCKIMASHEGNKFKIQSSNTKIVIYYILSYVQLNVKSKM